MNKLYKIWLLSSVLMIAASCANDSTLYYTYEKPESIANQEEIDAYKDLNTYVNREANPTFKLGAGISLSDYTSKSVMYRLVNKNFDEITLGYEMKHGAVVQADGSLNLDNVTKLLGMANEANVSVFGHALCWHANQNAAYLKSLIAPEIIPGNGPGWDVVTAADFETDNNANYQVNGSGVTSFTAAGEGKGGTGRALKIVNATVRTNDWDVQFFVKFSPPVQLGEKYQLTMDVRSEAAISYPTQAHVTPGAYKHWDFFGTIPSTPTWTTYSKEITISAEMATCGAIAFNLGKGATTFYFDNIVLKKYNALGGSTSIEKTPEQKKILITEALDKWTSGMVTASKTYVKAWDVVNEPMDDGSPYNLKTGVGKTLKADEFYWQDYLGKDYAVEAFKLSRKYGNPTDILFVNDYNLEYSLDKCKGLIQYVQYIESKGQKVDGIGTQMHITINSDKDKIASMFQLLAATGKLIKVSELDVAAGLSPTAADFQKQTEMYKYVVDMYTKYIPVNQRYGITVWGVTDSKSDSSWLPGQHQGLWNVDFTRKSSYTGFAEGLKGLK